MGGGEPFDQSHFGQSGSVAPSGKGIVLSTGGRGPWTEVGAMGADLRKTGLSGKARLRCDPGG